MRHPSIARIILAFILAPIILNLVSCNDDGDPKVITPPVVEPPIEDDTVAPLKPFPQHTEYAAGTIKPNHKTQEKLDSDLTKVYNMWRTNYLRLAAGTTDQYYIQYQTSGPVTVSEAHGYGMVVFAIMAGHEKRAKRYFDGMYKYFKAHPSPNNASLMDWQQALQNGNIVSIGGSSATDGDMDIAYALLLADKQWGSDGLIDYKEEAIKIINALKTSVVHTSLNTLKLGDWASQQGTRLGDATRTSDFMLQHMKSFEEATGDETWTTVTDNSYGIINSIFADHSAATGLLPDFAEYKGGKFIPAEGQLLEGETDKAYSYNAARIPWRIGTDYIITGDTRAEAQLTALNNWIRTAAEEDPTKIKSGYYLDGTMYPGRDYQDLTFQSPFVVSAMIHADNQEWLNDLWDNAASKNSSYFGDSIALLSLIVASGNWWMP